MALAIDIMDGCGLSNKTCREHLPCSVILVQDAAVLVAKLETRRSASVYKGEWA